MVFSGQQKRPPDLNPYYLSNTERAMLLICSTHHLCFTSFASDGEIEQIFGNIHPTSAKKTKVDEYCRLKVFGRSRRRFQIDTKQVAFSLFRKRVFQF